MPSGRAGAISRHFLIFAFLDVSRIGFHSMPDETPAAPASSVSKSEIEAALNEHQFGAIVGRSAPAFLASGEPMRVVWANAQALALFSADSVEALTSRCLDGQEPGARQLARLARRLDPGAPARLQRLLFDIEGSSEMLTFLCRRFDGRSALFGVAALDVRPALLEGKALAQSAPGKFPQTSEPSQRPETISVQHGETETRQENPAPQNSSPVESTRAAEPLQLEQKVASTPQGPAPEIAQTFAVAVTQQKPAPGGSFGLDFAGLPIRRDRGGNVRFLWRTGRDGRLIDLAGALCETVGCDTQALIGESFVAVIERFGVDPQGKLRAALARRETWSGIEVNWPVAGTSDRLPIIFGALPAFDRARNFDGFSGFGVIHVDRRFTAQTPVLPAPEILPDSDIASAVAPPAQDAPDDRAAQVETPQEISAQDSLQQDGPSHSAADETRSASGQAMDHAPDSEVDKANAAAAGQQNAEREDSSDTPLASADPGSAGESAKAGDAVSKPVPPLAGRLAPNVVALRRWQQHDGGKQLAKDAAEDKTKPLSEQLSAGPAGTDAPQGASEAGDQSDSPTAPPVSESGTSTEKQHDTLQPPRPETSPDKQSGRTVRYDGSVELSPSERNAFREIARALGAKFDPKDDAPDRRRESARLAQPEKPAEHKPAGQSEAERPAASMEASMAAASDRPEPPRHGLELEMPASAVPEEMSAQNIGSNADHQTAALLDRLDAAVLVTCGGVAAYANRTFLEWLGYKDIDAFHAAGGIDHMFKGRSPEALTSEADGGAIPVMTASGDVLALEGRMQTIEWANAPAMMMTLRQPRSPELIAKLRALELDVRKSEREVQELHAILDTATDGVAILDEEGRLLSLNKSGQALFGFEQNEIAGEKFTVLLARESHASAFDYLDGLKNNGVKIVLNDGREVTGQARRGGPIPLFMTIGRIGAQDELRFCAVMRDLTQWKKVERELHDARREAEHTSALKSDFLAKISHEIRTPLNAILGFAEVIIDERFGPVGNERYKDYLKDIHTSGNHVLSLVNDLLDLSKIEAGKLDLNFVSVDSNRIVNECVSIMQAQAIRERVIMRLSLAPRLPNIVADERSLRQIVLNILSNAIKFNQPGGQVIVSTALTDAGHAVIRVRDTGIGMSDQEMEQAIEPFRRVATARQTSGTGLGLPLTKALTEANRAAFSIKSRKGEGTMVEVAFPPTRVLAE